MVKEEKKMGSVANKLLPETEEKVEKEATTTKVTSKGCKVIFKRNVQDGDNFYRSGSEYTLSSEDKKRLISHIVCYGGKDCNC